MSDTRTTKVEFAIIVDEDGDYVVRDDADEAVEAYREHYGGSVFEVTNVAVTVSLPKARTVTGELPEGENVNLTLTAC